MPDDRPYISSSRLAAADIARHSFESVRRGFDPQAVRAFLEQVAREFGTFEQRENDIREALTEAEEKAAHPVLDEATLSAALGQHSAQILRNAHEEAARIVVSAEENAAAVLREAQGQANEIQVRAESAAAGRVADAEIAAGAIESRAAESNEALHAQAVARGEVILAQAREQGRGILEKAQQARKEVLSDLAQRRRGLGLQIEQFRAARDELAAAVGGVRGSVDTILDDLARADDDARAAAQAAASRPLPDDDGAVELDDDVELHEVEDAGPEPEPTAAVPSPDLDTGEVPVVTKETPVAAETSAPDHAGEAAGTESVDDLFARLRAGADPDAAPANASSAQAHLGGTVTSSEGVRLVGDATEEPAPALAATVEAGLAQHRGLMLDPLAVKLGRRLKRALQDDQNRLLEAARHDKGVWSDEFLVAEEQQQALYVDAAGEILREAFTSGVDFAREIEGTAGKVAKPDAKVVDPLAGDLAVGIVAHLRRRLLGDDAGAPGSDAADRIGAAYREWRGERIERLVGDFALGAFSAGVVASSKANLQWTVTVAAGCPDCDDNSLAGAIAPGEEFPTGHQYPPAHAGCRCLIAPTPV